MGLKRSATGGAPRSRAARVGLLVIALVFSMLGLEEAGAAADPCTGLSAVACENLQPGTDPSIWDIDGAGSNTIQGFATDMSVNVGQVIGFKVKTDARAYALEIYRLGWYQGNGARLVATLAPSATLPQSQPACLSDSTTNNLDCGNWAQSASWSVPTTAVSGVYIARLVRSDTGADSHVPFVVRNDASHSDVVFQTSDTTWQAYNTWGGSSMYGGPNGPATKVSYNRPWGTRGGIEARDFLFANEYPMIRFLERNGYDLSYISGVDADRSGSLLTNHRTFLSVGHDEYWSGHQRANVEAARDAGVNLAFFSGNEVYWKTRWENSVDGSSTSHRTLVCYKETRANAKTDPSPEWTGTWRDPRFSPPSDGGRPENALTGTAYMSNNSDLAIKVSAAEGKLRFWRGTSAAVLPAGGTETLSAHSIGYESDEDLDNGFRPGGLVRMSTTVGAVPEYLQDYGSTVAPGTTTHHLTMYRAASGAIVFGAGTIQWPWGLDDRHDGTATATNATMQQATVNLLADMRAQPTTLMSGLALASATTDSAAPTVTVSSPAAGAQVGNGTSVTVTGTASDAQGTIAGVEVSTDGGSTWHPAQGTASWSYAYVQHGTGTMNVLVRATDDSLNTSAPVTLGLNVTCPCSLFGAEQPATIDSGDPSGVELGVRFTSSTHGWVTGVRFYKASTNTGTHVGSLWTSGGALVARGTFVNETASGWQTMTFAAPVEIAADTAYVASYSAPVGHYSQTLDKFRQAVVSSPLTAPAATATAGNGVYSTLGNFPVSQYGAPSYAVDVVFSNIDTFAPVLQSTTPLSGASSVPLTTPLSAVLSEDVVPASVVMALATSGGVTVPGTTTYDVATRAARFTPDQPLATDTAYVATVNATDLAGNPTSGATFGFRSAAPDQTPGVCPCTVWNDSTVPPTKAYPDASANELGMRFSVQVDGLVTGLRFYKGVGNDGTHTGSLWSASGTRLATGTFSTESTEGWQTLTFSTPVSVTAGTSYLVSYFGPRGHYALDMSGFASAGLTVTPFVVPQNGGAYRVGSTGFPANASGSNYWVQPVFTVPAGAKPTVSATTPSSGTTNVRVDSSVRASFSTVVQPASVVVTLTGPSGTLVPGATQFDTQTQTATFVPSAALADGTVYQVSVSGAASMSGAVMDPVAFSFTTAGAAVCPCTAFSSTAAPITADAADASAITLGLRFVPTVNGNIQGVRFYKSAANTGTHTGSLWSSTGQRLATGTFTGETSSGWQMLTFAQPVDVVAGQSYVVSYFTPSGHYAADLDAVATGWTNGPLQVPGGGNGVYAYGSDTFPTGSYRNTNYWVDPVFATGAAADQTAPTLTTRSPIASASSVASSTPISATFSEPVSAASLSFVVKDATGVVVAGTAALDALSTTATFTPTATLAAGVTFTVTVSASDPAGNNSGAISWTFTSMAAPATPGVCPCGLWDDTAVPAIITDVDASAIEVGVKFTVDRQLRVTGLRFYKGPANTGQHIGTLWSDAGAQLAQASFTNESSTGWQRVSFATPVTVQPGATYVVSYGAPSGHISATIGGLAGSVDSPPVHAPAGSGLYRYGGGFPSTTSTTNYWVDPVLDDLPPVISNVLATPSGSSLVVSWSTDVTSSTRVDYGTTASALSSSVTGAAGTTHSATIPGLVPNTKYYYRVTSAVGSASATSPDVSQPAAVFAPTPVPLVTDTATEFSTGTTSNTTIGTMAGGVVTLKPTFVNELNASSLGSGLTSSVLATGGTTAVGGGLATLTGTQVQGNATYTTTSSVTWAATLSGSDQRLGWYAASPALNAWFTRDPAGNLVAVTVDAAGQNSTIPIPGTYVGQHEYRVDWSATAATYFIDGVQVSTNPFSPGTTALRIVAADAVVAGGGMPVDWVRVAPYTTSGTYTSKVIDAGASVGWESAQASAVIPTGTTLVLRVRSGNTATPDSTWTGWATVPASGAINAAKRYIQYQVALTTTGVRFETPTVSRISLTYHLL